MNRRAIIIVLDSVGIGEMEDSHLYGDCGSNTLKNTSEAVGGLQLPNLQALGLGNLENILGVSPMPGWGAFGKMKEKSPGKDTTTGHWEMMGIILPRPFPTYPEGFPAEIIEEFEKRIGKKILGNVVASGTEIIRELGEKHISTGFPIVYTSADSVFQIAAHEEIIPLEELYVMCRVARDILQGEHAVGRVIARPFRGAAGEFIRTPNRHDFSREPDYNVLDFLTAAGKKVVGIGKIADIFAGRAVSESYSIRDNQDGIEKIIRVMKDDFNGLIFANLLDFDQLYGHRNDSQGFARALEEFDAAIPRIIETMGPQDILFISADHGCDPTTSSTDHSREQVPLLVYGNLVSPGVDLGTRTSFADLGLTIAEFLGVETKNLPGESFFPALTADEPGDMSCI